MSYVHKRTDVSSYLSGCVALALIPVALVVSLVGWTVWRASDWTLPDVARGMPSRFSDGDRLFKKRIFLRYPVGSSEARLRADLEAAGFKIRQSSDGQNTADLGRFIGCGDKIWSVRWQADHGTLTEVYALYGAICL